MEVRRMELRQGDARGILSAAFKVCISLKSILLLILLLSVAYESAIERYAAFTLTTGDDGKTSFQFAVEPQTPQNNQTQIPAPQESFLSKLLRFSISLPDPASELPGEKEDSNSGTTIENHPVIDEDENHPVEPDSEASGINQGEFLHEDEHGINEGELLHEDEHPELRADVESDESIILDNGDRLPALKIKYTGNATGSSTSEAGGSALDEFNMGFFSSRFRGRRGGGLDRKTTEPSIALGVLLLAFVAFLLVLALVFFLLCFNQAFVPAVLGFSAISVIMGKPVRLRRALTSGLRVGLSRLMWISVLYSVFMGANSLLLSRVLLRSSQDVEELLYRLSTMPFAFLSIFSDEKIVGQGMVKGSAMFLLGEYLFDSVSYAVFIVACWVTILEREYRGMRAFKRSWELLRVLPRTAVCFRVFESFLAGRSSKFVIQKGLGSYGALLVVGSVDLYMTVVWLVYYLEARSRLQREFGHRELDEFLDRVR